MNRNYTTRSDKMKAKCALAILFMLCASVASAELPGSLQDREYRKFAEDEVGNVGVRVISSSSASASGSLVTGTKTITIAGSAEQITATSTPIAGVWVSADLGNTNPVVVGDSSVVAASDFQQGVVLIPGNPAVYIEVTDLSSLYVDSITNGDKLCYAYVQSS